MYSSIMDYDARFYADSFEGIGPYDNAAIQFGYGELVEVFDGDFAALAYGSLVWMNDYNDIPKIFDGSLNCATLMTCHLDYLAANDHYNAYNRATDLHTSNEQYALYQRNLNSYWMNALENATPAVENINKRKFVPFEDMYKEWTDYYNDVDYSIPFDEVDYNFCPDEFRWEANIGCQAWDKGANFTEVIADRALRHDRYYYFNNFKRDRYAWRYYGMGGYISSIRGRFLGPMSAVYRYFFYGNNGMGYDKNGDYLYLSDFPVGKDWQKASMTGLNYLAGIINQPEAGWHCLKDGAYVPWQDGEGNLAEGCASGDTMEVPLGVGKHYFTKWTDEYYFKPTRVGTFWDKWVALWSMTYNEGTFYQNFSDWLDSGSFSLSYWRGGLKEEMMDFFGSAMTGKQSPFTMRVNDQGEYVMAPVGDIYEGTEDVSMYTPVEGSWSWTLRWLSVLLPMARFNSMYDYTEDFSTYTRVCLDGYIDCLTYKDENGNPLTTSYTDPMTGYKYIAPGDLTLLAADEAAAAAALAADPTDEDLQDSAEDAHAAYKMRLAAHMLKDAQAYADTVYTPAKTAWEAAQAAYEADGSDANRTAMLEAEVTLRGAERGVDEHTSYLDIIRDLGYRTEYAR